MRILRLTAFVLWGVISACGEVVPTGSIGSLPPMFPDYSGVTVPRTIAPLDFRLEGCSDAARLLLDNGLLTVDVKGPEFVIPYEGWRELLSVGEEVKATVLVKQDGEWKSYQPFTISISDDEIDSHIAYRLIDPGYESWHSMGIYQRCIENFEEKAIITNDKTDDNCMNCHSFAGRDPSRMVFHMRAKNGGTYVTSGGKIQKLNTKTPQTLSATVYPQWSNDGRYIAFSVNDIWQVFHSTDANRIEVYDEASDVVVYDSSSQELLSCPKLMQEDVLETFPTFSPDGTTLFFCSSPRQKVPEDYAKIRYDLCSIPFNPKTGEFGQQVDTLFRVSDSGLSATFPRVSPDGKWLMFAASPYGCFNIWHKKADLYLMNLSDGSVRCLDEICSDDAESYHSWSSNSRWFIFGSRRIDGLFTRPYICHMDKEGNCSKPFLLPQECPDFYDDSFKSYNIPEFIHGAVTIPQDSIVDCAWNGKALDLTFRGW